MNVCPPASPAASQNSAGIGRVATISEYTGTTERGASCADHASVARTTVPAVTTPRSVTTRRGPTAVAVVASTMRPPRRSTARARPRTSRAGWMRAQSGVYDAPEHAGGADERRRLLRRDEEPGSARARAAAPGCGRGRSCRPSPSRRRCPPRPPPCRPRRRCRASPRPSPAPPRGRADGSARPRSPGTAPSTSRRCARSRRSPRPAARPRARAGPGRRAAGGRPSRAR